jgi:sec-independent protein translocase protein TatC
MEPDEGRHGTFWDHIGSLRNHILAGGGIFIVAVSLVFTYGTGTLISYLLAPLGGQNLVFLSPLGPFFFTLQISVYAACALCVPAWLALVLNFLFPALSLRQRIISALFVAISLLLTAASLVVAYLYLIPTTLRFLLTFVVPGTSFLLTADSYVNFFLLEFCVAFVILQIPLAIVLLAYMRALNPYALARKRRILYIGLLIMLAILTPTTDAFTLIVVSIPAICIAEVGIVLAKLVYGSPHTHREMQEGE